MTPRLGWSLLILVAATGLVVGQANQQPMAPGYRQVLPWGPVPEDPGTLAGYVVRNRDVFWEMGRVAVNTKGDRLYAFRRSDPPLLQIDPATGKIIKEWGAGMSSRRS